MPFCRWVPFTLKVLRPKDYLENPKTLEQHLKKCRKKLGLLQCEAAVQMGRRHMDLHQLGEGQDGTRGSSFPAGRTFLDFDPSPSASDLSAARRCQKKGVGSHPGALRQLLNWDPGTLTRYLNGTWPIPVDRMAALERLQSAEDADLSEHSGAPAK